jgi:FO synthase subunit 2
MFTMRTSHDTTVGRILERVSAGERIGSSDTAALLAARGDDARAVWSVADGMRSRRCGDEVTYVVNRNVNFTSCCTGSCLFCNFHTSAGNALSMNEVRERIRIPGLTEVCLQGGLHPSLGLPYYVELLQTVHRELPSVHVHAFSPAEIDHISVQEGIGIGETLRVLREAGLGSIPGTAAEILDDSVRSIICPEKIPTARWKEIITTAHSLGIPSTATMMYGHVETYRQRADHLLTIREIQERTGGFTEFVPLSYLPGNELGRKYGLTGASGLDDLNVHAVSRIVLNDVIPNIQASWVKLGWKLTTVALCCGANDVGGTLYEENISRASGGTHGERAEKKDIEAMIRLAGRTPRQRDTLYTLL